ncbi:MAG: glycine cleavage system protein GcvH [Thermovirga sp.]
MANMPEELRYTETHEWIKVEEGKAWIGVTDFAQHAMGDVVYVELPEIGKAVSRGEDFCVVESVKGANDVYAPLSGTILEVNGELEDSPELVNADAYGSWIAVLEISDPSEIDHLLTWDAYRKLVAETEKKEG